MKCKKTLKSPPYAPMIFGCVTTNRTFFLEALCMSGYLQEIIEYANFVHNAIKFLFVK